MITLKNIASTLDVSIATVSYAMSNNWQAKGIAPATRDAILGKARELGYRRNRIAVNLKKQCSTTAGIIVPALGEGNYDSMLKGAYAALHDEYTFLLGIAGYDPEQERRLLHAFEENMVAGIIVVGTGSASNIDELKRLRLANVPIVQADRFLEDVQTDVVEADGAQLGDLLVGHLYDLGHRHIAYIRNPHFNSSTRGREKGYIDAMRSRGLSPKLYPQTVPGMDVPVIEFTCRQMRQLFSDKSTTPTAVIAHAYDTARGCLKAIGEYGLSCPEDISICTVCGEEHHLDSINSRLQLTMAKWSIEEMGRKAGEYLWHRISNPQNGERSKSPQIFRVPGRLVVGNSCDKPKN